jgi:hypothetical protein
MAKGKHSVALFEVIQLDSRFKKTAPVDALKTPSWWFKRSGGEKDVAAKAATLARTRPAAAPAPKREHVPDQSIKPVSGPSLVELAEKALINLRRQAQGYVGPRISPLLSPLSGVAAACIVIVCVLAIRHFTGGAHTAEGSAFSTDQLRLGPAHPEVLQVFDGTPATPVQTPKRASTELLRDQVVAEPASNNTPPIATRQINLNYVLMQGYADEVLANKACEFLNKNGVACTIERGVKNWRKDFYLVIGLQGFTRASGPDYVAYKQRVQALSLQFAPATSYKGFKPQAIKWEKN